MLRFTDRSPHHFDDSSDVATENGKYEVTCAQTTTALQAWATLLLVVPTVTNIVSAVFAALTIVQIIRLRRITDGIQSSTNWLTRTAVRASLGPTAKRALIEYARKKPGLEQYVLAPPTVASIDSDPPQDIGSVC